MNKINNLGVKVNSPMRIIINALISGYKSIGCGCNAKNAIAYNVYCGYRFYKHNVLWLEDRECNRPLTALYRKESKSDKIIGGACFVTFLAMVILVGVSL